MISEEAALAAHKRVIQRLVPLWMAIGVVLIILADATIDKLFFLAVVPWFGWIAFGVVVLALAVHNAYSLTRLRRLGRAMATLSALPVAAGLLVVSAPFLARAGASSICCAHPSDASLIRRLAEHRPEFERLVAMSDADARVIRVAPSFTRLVDDWGWPRADSLLGFSPERWREYRSLFRALHLEGGLERGEGAHPTIYLLASGRGMVTGGSRKGYVYSPTALAPVYASLDSIPPDLASNVTGYRHLSGPWYLFYSWDD